MANDDALAQRFFEARERIALRQLAEGRRFRVGAFALQADGVAASAILLCDGATLFIGEGSAPQAS